MADEMLRRLDEMSPEERRAAVEEYVGFLITGAVMGAASHGIVLAPAEIRQAFQESTREVPFADRLRALVVRCAREQGVAVPGPLGMMTDDTR